MKPIRKRPLITSKLSSGKSRGLVTSITLKIASFSNPCDLARVRAYSTKLRLISTPMTCTLEYSYATSSTQLPGPQAISKTLEIFAELTCLGKRLSIALVTVASCFILRTTSAPLSASSIYMFSLSLGSWGTSISTSLPLHILLRL